MRTPVQETLHTLRALTTARTDRAWLDVLRGLGSRYLRRIAARLRRTVAEGHVRECHGDLHLGNVTLVDGHTTLFDCLEFDPALRWTDVMSDVAFMAMDLHAHRLPRLSHRFVNGYVERSGDHGGLRVLRYHCVYRALVRAKIAALRKAQLKDAGHAAEPLDRRSAPDDYLDVACGLQPARAADADTDAWLLGQR